MKSHLLAAALLALSCALSGQATHAGESLRFAGVLNDNMVLQRGRDITIWGWASPGSHVEVMLTQSEAEALAFVGADALARPEPTAPDASQDGVIGDVRLSYVDASAQPLKTVRLQVKAQDDGRWEANLGTHAASFTSTILAARSGTERKALRNLLIGELWIASGQSNMAWGNTRDKMWENEGLLFNAVRYARVQGHAYQPAEHFPADGGKAEWVVCEGDAARNLSTVPYLFAQLLHRRLKVPVGIINIAQGGSYAREWCSRPALEAMKSPTVNRQLKLLDEKIAADPNARLFGDPADLYNARFHPLRHLTIAGMIYLQGENEALTGDLPQYLKTFPGMIETCRQAMGRPDLPFGIITLQGMGRSDGSGANSGYAVARAIHQQTQQVTPHTGYIAAHDIGGGIHPNWKRPLAERTVYWALLDVYKVIENAQRIRIAGVHFQDGKALVDFEATTLRNGAWNQPTLVTPPTNNQDWMDGFVIAGSDRQWYPGRIEKRTGDSKGLVISHPMVSEPIALRYAWDGWPRANLGSWEDPVPPYRSDDWSIVGADEVVPPDSDKLSASATQYNQMNDRRNRKLEESLTLAIRESRVNLTKRHATAKGILLGTTQAMLSLLDNFDAESYAALAPGMRRHALHNIPCRYWRRDRYSPERRAKWSWLIERVLRLESLPGDMENATEQPDVATKLADAKTALEDLKGALLKLPDAEAMTFDTMLDRILPIMEEEKKRLSDEGYDMEKQKRALNPNRF